MIKEPDFHRADGAIYLQSTSLNRWSEITHTVQTSAIQLLNINVFVYHESIVSTHFARIVEKILDDRMKGLDGEVLLLFWID